MEKSKFESLSKFVAGKRDEKTVYPKRMDVFNWAKMEIKKTKVVILGQDPYHGPNQAHGLSFSVLRPTPPPPRRVLKMTYPGYAKIFENFLKNCEKIEN